MEAIHKLASRTSHLSVSGGPPGAEPAIPHSAVVEESVPDFSATVSSALEEIYNSLAADPASKADFLHKVQGEEQEQEQQPSPAATETAAAAATAADDGKKQVTDHLASLDAFKSYMASPASAAMRPAKKQLLSAPITDYFISSSHNTYLTGNQLYSDAAPDAYKNVRMLAFLKISISGQWMGSYTLVAFPGWGGGGQASVRELNRMRSICKSMHGIPSPCHCTFMPVYTNNSTLISFLA